MGSGRAHGSPLVSGEWEGTWFTSCEWGVTLTLTFDSSHLVKCWRLYILQSVLQPEPTTASSVSVQPQEDGGGVLPGPSPLHEKGNNAPSVWQTSCPGVVPTAASIEDRPLPTLVNK